MIEKTIKIDFKKGFTLIELLLAISIFMIFMLALTNSFLHIIRTQKTANETRLMYSELRNFVDYVSGETREGMIDYYCYDISGTAIDNRCDRTLSTYSSDNLKTISADGLSSSVIKFDSKNNKICLSRYKKVDNNWKLEDGYDGENTCGNGYKEFAFSNLSVKDLRFEIFPKTDPANQSMPIKPIVRMYLRVGSKIDTVKFDLKYQTLLTVRN